MKDIPRRLRRAREGKGITITEMAKQLKTHRKKIYALETYTGYPPKIDLKDIEDYSEITETPLSVLLLGYDLERKAYSMVLKLQEHFVRIEQSNLEAIREIIKLIEEDDNDNILNF